MKRFLPFAFCLLPLIVAAQLTRSIGSRSALFLGKQAPSISINVPRSGAVYTNGSDIVFSAAATGNGAIITNVTWIINNLAFNVQSPPYQVILTNALAGDYIVFAIASDSNGSLSTAAFREFTVTAFSNIAPTVTLDSPATGTHTLVGNALTVTGTAADADGTINEVRLYSGTLLIATDATAPYSFNWIGPPGTDFPIVLVAQDNQGTLATSAPPVLVSFTNNPPVVTNQAPAIVITSPANGSLYTAPATVNVLINATDIDGTINRVEVFVNNVLAGTLTNTPYIFTETGVGASPSRTYHATAYDNSGSNTISGTVSVTINAPPPQPPGPPTGLAALGGDAQVTLSWQVVSGASGYSLSKAVSGGSFATLTNITTLSFVDTAVTNGTTYLYRIASQNAQGTGTPSASVSVQPLGPAQATSIVRGSVWKFFDDDTNLGAGSVWGAVAFNDSAWLYGAAPLGYGDSDIATLISLGRQSVTNTTTYFRQHFTVTTPANITNLILNAIVDDGAVFFLNGTEVYRRGVPAGENYHTLANAQVSGTDERTWSGTNYVNPALLVAGDNVLAVRLHSRWNSLSPPDLDSDLVLDVEMYESSTVPPTAPIAPSALQATAGSSSPAGGGQASGTEYFVAASGGSALNSGLTVAAPWTLSHALSNAGAGNTITLLDGSYPSFRVIKSRQLVRARNRLGAKVLGTETDAFRFGIIVWAAGGAAVTNCTIDGIEVDHAWGDGISVDFNSHGTTIKNCWIHHSGWGDPASVTNTSGAYTGQGIGSHGANGVIFENNLIEYNGAWYTVIVGDRVGHDHGIYAHGTNIVIRGNVIRQNFGCQIVLQDEQTPQDVANSQTYNNLMVSKPGSSGGTVNGTYSAYTFGAQTNYAWNNTIYNPETYAIDGGHIGNGILCLTNNIILGDMDPGRPGGGIRPNNNMSTSALSFPGANDVVASPIGFVNQNNYLYWLTASSQARNAAFSLVVPFDFFKNTNRTVTDIGAFQFDPVLATDNRNLSGNLATNFWDQSFTVNGSQTTIYLAWQDNSNNETGFDVEMGTNGTTFPIVSSVGANTTVFTASGLTDATTYYFRVRARNATGNSTYSNVASATTQGAPPAVLPAPTGLVAQAGNATVAVRWNPVSGATGYAVTRAIAANGPFSLVASPSSTNITDTAVTNNVTYYYQVATVNAAGTGPASASASATPTPAATPPAAPTTLVATAGTAGIINLTWTNPATDETGTEIEEGSDGVNFTLINTTGVNATSYSRTGLGSNLTRFYRVRNRNGAGNSAYSNTDDATTITVTNPPGFYVSTTATGSGDGSFNNPWTILQAFAGPAALVNASSRVVWFKGGTYTVPVNAFNITLQGSSGNPYVFRALNRPTSTGRATIDRNNAINGARPLIRTADPSGGNGASYVYIQDFDLVNNAIRTSDSLDKTEQEFSRADGFNDNFGHHNKIINCIVRDHGGGIVAQNNSGASGIEASGNVVMFSGWRDQSQGRGHNFYLQNKADPILVKATISWCAYGQGFQMSGSDAAFGNKTTIEDSIFFQNGRASTENANSRNALFGSANLLNDITVRNSVFYYPIGDGSASLNAGQDSAEQPTDVSNSNLLIEDNFLVGRLYFGDWIGATIRRNVGYNNGGPTIHHRAHSGLVNSGHTVNGNLWASTSSTPFQFNGANETVTQWRAHGYDTTSTVLSSIPTTNTIRLYVRPYDPGVANIAIFNPSGGASVNVSLAGFATTGEHLEIRSVTDPYQTPLDFPSYNGTSISVPMNPGAWNIRNPACTLGVTGQAPPQLFPQFGAFIVNKWKANQ